MNSRKRIISLGEGPAKKVGHVDERELAAIEARFGARKLEADRLPPALAAKYLAAVLDAEAVLATLLHVAGLFKSSREAGIVRMARIKAMRAKLVELGVDEEELGTDPTLGVNVGGKPVEITAADCSFAGKITVPEPPASDNGASQN